MIRDAILSLCVLRSYLRLLEPLHLPHPACSATAPVQSRCGHPPQRDTGPRPQTVEHECAEFDVITVDLLARGGLDQAYVLQGGGGRSLRTLVLGECDISGDAVSITHQGVYKTHHGVHTMRRPFLAHHDVVENLWLGR